MRSSIIFLAAILGQALAWNEASLRQNSVVLKGDYVITNVASGKHWNFGSSYLANFGSQRDLITLSALGSGTVSISAKDSNSKCFSAAWNDDQHRNWAAIQYSCITNGGSTVRPAKQMWLVRARGTNPESYNFITTDHILDQPGNAIQGSTQSAWGAVGYKMGALDTSDDSQAWYITSANNVPAGPPSGGNDDNDNDNTPAVKQAAIDDSAAKKAAAQKAAAQAAAEKAAAQKAADQKAAADQAAREQAARDEAARQAEEQRQAEEAAAASSSSLAAAQNAASVSSASEASVASAVASSSSQAAFEAELAAFWETKLESMNSAKSESVYWSTKLELMNSVKSESLASASALSVAATAPPQVTGTQIAVLDNVADGVNNLAILVGSASVPAPAPSVPTASATPVLRLHRRVRERFV